MTAASPSSPPSASSEFDLLTLHRHLRGLAEAQLPRTDWLLQLIHLLVRLTNPAAALVAISVDGQLTKGPRIVSRQALSWHSDIEALMVEQVNDACQTNQTMWRKLSTIKPGLVLIAVPTRVGDYPEGMALLLVEGKQPLEMFITLLQLMAGYVAFFQSPAIASSKPVTPARDALWSLVEQVLNAEDFTHAQQGLLNTLEQSLHCQRVVLGLRKGNVYRLHALSGFSEIRRQADFIHIVESYLNHPEALQNWVDSRQAYPADLVADMQRLLTVSASACIVSLPLGLATQSLEGTPLPEPDGVLILLWNALPDSEFLPRLRPIAPVLGKALRVQQRAHPSFLRRLWHIICAKRARKRVLMLALALLMVILLWPVPHRLSASCVVEPLQRRFVAVPFDGQLREALHEPGDLIQTDEVLARLDAREIEWRLSGLRAEYSRSRKQKDIHAAARDTAQAQLAGLEMERLQAQIDLLTYQMDNLALKSPINGILLSGDWKRAAGSPVNKGQGLFEIAPLEQMVVEIALPAEDIAYTALGQTAKIRLSAFPGQTWQRSVLRIRPRAEIQDNHHVFILETELDNPQQKLRPGMRGYATVTAGTGMLGWVLFHKVWERLLLWLH